MSAQTDGPYGPLIPMPELTLDALRECDTLGGRGFISFLAVPRHECVYICDITRYG
ncbi:hypothetical protein GTY20_19750 [Streptomyces sp. SID4946]|uniref:hypothetical protein n=1 Tax=Streptomyces sp. LamerLS-31b TaxID=1839765 RepID=UPI00081E00A0|nr:MULTISPECIES: hypothetical protein [unclassified Streptomyces]MYQ93389.1 hypothetical protein [Streptomyces sp. SID4946]SCF81533.1 hypothetical protein GA0115256_120823 [Streptomyces sp. DconLS]SCG04308.1 hypothetical protein GA0115258_127246 [Streptomyces sp. LamerLS-31b]